MAAKQVNKEALVLLTEAKKHKPQPRQSWLQKLPDEQREAIIEAYRALPDTGASVLGLVKAIAARYSVQAKESSIRHALRQLDNQ